MNIYIYTYICICMYICPYIILYMYTTGAADDGQATFSGTKRWM